MANKNRVNVLLTSTAGTGYSYVKTKPTKGEKASKKLELKKFDPRAVNSKTGKKGMYVQFTEKKLVYKAN